jgi:hypothetical protein
MYTDKGLYRVAPKYREAPAQPSLPIAAAEPDADSNTGRSEPQTRDRHHDQLRPAGSDIERLYNRYHG